LSDLAIGGIESGICGLEERSSTVVDRRYMVEEWIGALESKTRVLEK